MNRKNISIEDLAAAIDWLNSYDRSDEQDEMADALINVIEYLRADIAKRHAATLERQIKADIKRGGKTLTEVGKVQLRDLCAEKGNALADSICADLDRGSLVA